MHPRLRSVLTVFALVLLAPLTHSVLGAPKVVNLSTRLKVETGGSVGIAGFVIRGNGVKPVLIRALGPSLSASGVTGVLANPSMEIYDSAGKVIRIVCQSADFAISAGQAFGADGG